jgi:hypothetical protein
MQEALADLAAGRTPERRVDFQTLRGIVGFDEYDRLVATYADQPLLSTEETP